MRKHGIDETTARFVQVGGHAARLQAVICGRADATLVNTVTALKGVMDGKVTVVARLSAEFPGLGYVWNVVRTEALAKAELAAAFQTMTDIGIRGSRFIMANPDEAAAILHERLGELDLALLTEWCAISTARTSGAGTAGPIPRSRNSPPPPTSTPATLPAPPPPP